MDQTTEEPQESKKRCCGWRAWFWCALVIAAALAINFMVNMPGSSFAGAAPQLGADEAAYRDRLLGHVDYLANTVGPRFSSDALARAEQYIRDEMRAIGYDVKAQEFSDAGRKFRNLIAEKPGGARASQIIVLGAHYDTAVSTPGANDNASGVAALIELARWFKGVSTERTVRFVFFVNEEPPYFHTDLMGSRVYSASLKAAGDDVVAMLSLETIGYYTGKPKTQHYPFPFGYFYPQEGNFVAFVGDVSSRALLNDVITGFRASTSFPSEGISAPRWVTGLDWSDQWSFWQEGYPAIMVTDTAIFRYPYYHTPQDTPDMLDYDALARVTLGVANSVGRIAGSFEPSGAETPR